LGQTFDPVGIVLTFAAIKLTFLFLTLKS